VHQVGNQYIIPEDGVLTPKHIGVILILILHYLFVHMLVCNKH